MLSDVLPGSTHPLGATLQSGGVNFAIYSRHATCLELLLFDAPEDAAPARVIRLEPGRHRTADYWHVLVQGLGAGQLYAWRAHGPLAPERGLRFDGEKVLLETREDSRSSVIALAVKAGASMARSRSCR